MSIEVNWNNPGEDLEEGKGISKEIIIWDIVEIAVPRATYQSHCRMVKETDRQEVS
jgi:hypothetical protein